jgi:hypothetical protein
MGLDARPAHEGVAMTRRGGRVVERQEQPVDITKLTVREISQAVRCDALTLEQAYVELSRRRAAGDPPVRLVGPEQPSLAETIVRDAVRAQLRRGRR